MQSEHEDIRPAVHVWQVKWHRGQNKRAPSSYQPGLQRHLLVASVIALLLTVTVVA